MQAAFETTQPVKPAPRSFQFSIKTLIISTTIAAVIFGLCMVPPIAAAVLIAIYAITIAMSIIASVSGRGWIRPFAMMSGIYLVATLVIILNSHISGPEEAAIILFVNLFVACGVGLTGAAGHGFLARRGGFVPVPNVPLLRNWLYNKPVEIQE